MKTCTRCHRSLPQSDFHRNAAAPDGLYTKCKACKSELIKIDRTNNPEKYRAANKRYAAKNRDKLLERAKHYNALPEYAEKRKVATKRWASSERGKAWTKAYKQKRGLLRAYWAVKSALKWGKLVRPTCCSKCGTSGKVQSHHHKGYEREHWLDVQWLCKQCHAAETPKRST